MHICIFSVFFTVPRTIYNNQIQLRSKVLPWTLSTKSSPPSLPSWLLLPPRSVIAEPPYIIGQQLPSKILSDLCLLVLISFTREFCGHKAKTNFALPFDNVKNASSSQSNTVGSSSRNRHVAARLEPRPHAASVTLSYTPPWPVLVALGQVTIFDLNLKFFRSTKIFIFCDSQIEEPTGFMLLFLKSPKDSSIFILSM